MSAARVTRRMRSIPRVLSAVDPVCGMTVDPATTQHHAEHDSTAFIISAVPAAAPSSLPTRHAIFEGRAIAAGSVYDRDLDLSDASRNPSAGTRSLSDLRHGVEPARSRDGRGRTQSRTRRYDAALLDRLALTAPVFLLEMGGHLFPALHHLVSERISGWIQFALATPLVIWAGWPFF